MIRMFLALLSFVMLGRFESTPPAPNPAPPATPPTPDPPAKPAKPAKPEGITDEIQEYFNGIVAKETRDAEKRGRSAADQDRQDAEAKAAKDKEIADAAAKGEYETAKAAIEAERDKHKADLDAIVPERDKLLAYFTADYDATIKDLPEAVLAFKPADDASFDAKSAFLLTAKEQAAKLNGHRPNGNHRAPDPAGPGREKVTSGLKKRQFLS